MANTTSSAVGNSAGLARRLPLSHAWSTGPEGALIADDHDDESKIAVIYDRGETPPTITIKQTAGQVQTVLANGVAVAVIACASGPSLTSKDVVLVERFVSAAQ